jgi:HKD family nuclease
MHRLFPLLALTAVFATASPVLAQVERLCDTEYEDCRAPLLQLIRNEQQGIDVGFWFMYDSRYSHELIQRFNAGVPVRIIMDERANASKPNNAQILQILRDAGIPMRQKFSGGIFHWKAMLFHGQNVVQFSAANYQSDAFVANSSDDWMDEAIYFTNDDNITNSFRRKFDDLWTSTSGYANYANVSGTPQRHYPTYAIHSSLNFVPAQEYANRATSRYQRETERIDVIMYRITDQRHTNTIIDARNRGIPVRLITEPDQYRDPQYLWHSWNVDRLYMAGVQIKHRQHQGLMHQKSVILYGLGEVIFGSSNWTSASANSQEEHNYFYNPALNKPWFLQWFVDQFERKWNATSAFVPFTPLPPGPQTLMSPANGGVGLPTTLTLRWEGGNWAHKYDIYLGTTPDPPLVAKDVVTGSPVNGTSETYSVSGLQTGTTYYWRIVGKTMADMGRSSPTWSFTTSGTAPDPNAPDVVLHVGKAPIVQGAWRAVSDATAASGVKMHQPNANVPKIEPASSSPRDYFELAFEAQAGTPYRLWFRGRADNDDWANDSVWVQFSNSMNEGGLPAWRIGSTSAIALSVEECSGCGLSGWGWHDNGWGVGVRGEPVYFPTSGVTTIRVQAREDGIAIDQVVLSPQRYFTTAPGATKNDGTILAESEGATGGDPAPPPSSSGVNEIVIHAAKVTTVVGDWQKVSDSSAASSVRLWNPDRGAPKLDVARSSPSTYFEFSFDADAGKPYHLWFRMRADNNHWANDSVFVQFSGSVNASGTPIHRIGTTDGALVALEAHSGAGLSGWGWNDNEWATTGPPIYFATTGRQTIRVQTREDGISIDQMVLSASTYLTARPGALKNDTTILSSTTP